MREHARFVGRTAVRAGVLPADIDDITQAVLLILWHRRQHGDEVQQVRAWLGTVTRRVAWDATAVKKGDEITGKATTTFHMPDFGITPPKVGPVQSIQDDVQLEIEITARKAA